MVIPLDVTRAATEQMAAVRVAHEARQRMLEANKALMAGHGELLTLLAERALEAREVYAHAQAKAKEADRRYRAACRRALQHGEPITEQGALW